MSGCAVALDVGGTSIKSGVVAAGGVVHGPVHQTPVDTTGPAEELLEALAAVIRQRREEIPGPCAGVGLGFPGPFDYPNGICKVRGVGGKFEALYDLDLGAELRTRAGLGDMPVRFRNDAQAAVVGEALFGAGVGADRVLGITLGTGLGAAFLAAGEPVAGREGVPEDGELYHQPFGREQADDVFGKRGLEARLVAAGGPEDVGEAAGLAAERAELRAVFETWGGELGQFLAPFLHAFRAERLIVLGGVARSLELFRGPLEAAVPCSVLPGARGGEGALLGAAALVLG